MSRSGSEAAPATWRRNSESRSATVASVGNEISTRERPTASAYCAKSRIVTLVGPVNEGMGNELGDL